MDCLSNNKILRCFRRIGTEYKLPNFRTIAIICINIFLIANVEFLNRLSSAHDSVNEPNTLVASPDGHTPMSSSSFHSYIIKLTIGSPWISSGALINFVRMKGSTSPPQVFRLYIPAHRCLFSSFWS